MIHGLSKYSADGADAGIDYFLAGTYFEKETEEWKPRDPAPVLLEGNPYAMRALCNSLDFKNKYTSGVLSFSKEETALIHSKPGLKEKILEDFKDFAFAGVKDDCRNILLVQHNHTGRLEVHYMIPRVHLESGKYFNPFPPNYSGKRGQGNNNEFISQNDSFVDHVCHKYDLQNPRDPLVQRAVNLPQFDPQKRIKQQVIVAIDQLINAGAISSREDMIKFLEKNGAKITRKGSNYFSFKFEGMNKAAKLEGELYGEQPFTAIAKRHTERAERFEAKRACSESRYSETLNIRSAEVESRHRIPTEVAERAKDRAAKSSTELQRTQKKLNDVRAVINNFSPSTVNAARNFVGQNKLITDPLINIPKSSPRYIIAPDISTGNKVHDELLSKFHSEMAGLIKKDIAQRGRLSDLYAKIAKQTIAKIESAIREIFSFSTSMYSGQNFYSPGQPFHDEISKFKNKIKSLIDDVKNEIQLAKKSEKHTERVNNLNYGQKTNSTEYGFGFATRTKIIKEDSAHGKDSNQQAERNIKEPILNPTSPCK